MIDAMTRGRIAAHLRVPLFRNAYALILNTGLTSGLGFVYWIVSARLYPPEVVGLNSAVLSAMIFLAGLAQFGLANVLIRFIPQAGKAALRLIDRAMLLTVGAGLLAGLVFVLGIDVWAPSLEALRAGPLPAAGFALSTAAWGAFALQEGVLTGLRRATWIPARNSAFAAGKIVLLFVLVALLPAYGIFISWIASAALALVPATLLIRRRLAAESRAEAPPGAAGVVPGQLVQYAAADYAGSLFWLAATSLVPVLVTEILGPAADAHFYLAWTIAYTLYLIAPSMGSSLIVEAAIDPARLESYARRAFMQTARLVVPMAALLVLAAPYVLGLLGNGYAAEGTPLMRLLALSAIPNIITALYTSIARARRQVGAIVGILAAQSISVLALSDVLLPLAGITGVGLAWLISQTAIAGTLLVALRRSSRPAV